MLPFQVGKKGRSNLEKGNSMMNFREYCEKEDKIDSILSVCNIYCLNYDIKFERDANRKYSDLLDFIVDTNNSTLEKSLDIESYKVNKSCYLILSPCTQNEIDKKLDEYFTEKDTKSLIQLGKSNIKKDKNLSDIICKLQ